MTTELTVYNGAEPLALAPAGHDPHAFEPANLGEALQLAKVLHAGRLLPKSFASPEAVVTAVILGRELGLSAMQSIRGIHVIEGKPTLSADLMVALVKRSPACAYFRLVKSSNDAATYETQRKGEPEPTSMTFSMDDAKAAGVTGKDNWRKFPSAMLRARCASSLARAVYPDLVMGIYDPDELEPTTEPQPAKYAQREPVPVDVETVTTAIAGPSEPEDAWGLANRRLRAVMTAAKKTLDLPASTVTALVRERMGDLYGQTSTKDCTPQELHSLADAIAADPRYLVTDTSDEDIPPFDAEAPFVEGEVD